MEEVEEECGYKVQPDQMEFVHKYYDLGCTRTLFYAGKIIHPWVQSCILH